MKAEGGMIQAATSAPATATTVTGGVVVGTWTQSDILFLLSATVLLCQIVVFGIRFWRSVKK